MSTDDAPRPPLGPLDHTRLGADSAEVPPGFTVELVDEASSTNALATERAHEGAPDGTVVVAENQTAGRGRLDRSWETPPGTAVTFSLVRRPNAPAASWPWLPLLTGLAVADGVRTQGVGAGVKWPNDVLIDGGKVAGILVERIETPAGPAAVIGVGINVALDAESLPVPTATSLLLAGGRTDRTQVLLDVLAAIHARYQEWDCGGESADARLREAYAAACITLGKDVRVELPAADVLVGRAVDVDISGRLVVESGEPTPVRRPISVGDVVHVR